MTTKQIECDYLIIGSGIAGLSAAIHAAKHGTVIIVTKKNAKDCNTQYAQGGISCVIDNDDTFEEHIQDTIKAGSGLCNQQVVEEIIKKAPTCIKEMIKWGVKFTKTSELNTKETQTSNNPYGFDLGKEGGHRKRRVLHAQDITGREIVRALLLQCQNNPNIQILENHIAVDLICNRHIHWNAPNNCLGAYIMDTKTGTIKTFLSKFSILATGGAGKVYRYTSNPDVANGDGLAMAYRAHAQIANMEFFQFHPTCLYHPAAKSFLISEAVRGEGAILKIYKNKKYVEFMQQYHEMASLAPRDIVARAIDNELKRYGQDCAYLDIRHHSEQFLRTRFPNIFQECLKFGINIATDLIPVVPAAHYCCGGVKTDVNGKTTVNRLYAIGEVGNTGFHGANRLASNSLLEAAVVAYNAIQDTTKQPKTTNDPKQIPNWSSGDAIDSDEEIVITHNWDEIRLFMWDYVGIVRTQKRLERAKNRIRLIRQEIEKYYWDFTLTPDLIELRNLASVAEMIIDSAMARKESIGIHYNQNYPNFDNIPRDTILRRPNKAVIWSTRTP